MTPEQSAWFSETFTSLVTNVSRAVLGADKPVRLVLTAMVAEGHVLLEDAPGTGKTSLAKAIAASVQGTHQRIQFTPDLLPSDVTGVTIWDQGNRTFQFHPGPVFTSVLLADEINRASPKTQSALLEVMEEGHVTVDRDTHPVGRPFVVIATQNPSSRRAPTGCRRRSSTGSWSAPRSATRTGPRRSRSCRATVTGPAPWTRS